MEIRVYLGESEAFASYDRLTRTFEIDTDRLTPALNGDYEIDVVATLKSREDPTKSRISIAKFSLTIEVPPREELGPICEEGYTMRLDCDEDTRFYCELHRTNCDCCIKLVDCPLVEEGKTGSSQPNPFVGEMTDTGLVKILWDKEMQSPGDVLELQRAIQVTEGRRQLDEVKPAIEVKVEPQEKQADEADNEYNDRMQNLRDFDWSL